MKDVYDQVSEELGLDVSLIKKTYTYFWKYIKEDINNLNLKNISEEEFKKMNVSYNIPSLGKLGVSFDKYKRAKNHFNYYRNAKDSFS